MASDHAIQAVDRHSDMLDVRATIPSSWDDKGWLDGASRVAVNVGRAIKSGAPDDTPPLEYVTLIVQVPGTDRLGNDVQIELFNITFRAGDLRTANYDGLSNYRLLNLATGVSSASAQGRQVLMAYCADDFMGAESNQFCMSAMTR